MRIPLTVHLLVVAACLTGLIVLTLVQDLAMGIVITVCGGLLLCALAYWPRPPRRLPVGTVQCDVMNTFGLQDSHGFNASFRGVLRR